MIRRAGTALIAIGLGGLVWAALVWTWEDPFTSAVSWYEQRKLARSYDERLRERSSPVIGATPTVPAPHAAPPAVRAAQRRVLRRAAARYRRELREGEALGRLRIPALDLLVVAVEGTEPGTLRRGPGRHDATFMPGEGRLVYIAGHRTTFGAPFADIDQLVRGDRVTFELPYATFDYAVTGRRIVPATYVQALRSRGREELALQACWPRFLASHRIIVYAKLLRIGRATATPHAR